MKKLSPSLLIYSLLRPIVRLCLRQGLRLAEIDEQLRKVLVAEAKEVVREAGSDVSASKISVITGIHRMEVTRLLTGKDRHHEKQDVLHRVLGLWGNKRDYRDSNNEPKALFFQGLDSEFAHLVATVSKEVSHYPILFELERVGAVKIQGDRVIMKLQEYVPVGDCEHGLELLALDVEALTETVTGNLGDRASNPDLHLRTYFDNIPPEHLEEVRLWILAKGVAFHKEARAYLSRFDRDMNPELGSGKDRASVVVSTFSLAKKDEAPPQITPKKRGRKKSATSTTPRSDQTEN